MASKMSVDKDGEQDGHHGGLGSSKEPSTSNGEVAATVGEARAGRKSCAAAGSKKGGAKKVALEHPQPPSMKKRRSMTARKQIDALVPPETPRSWLSSPRGLIKEQYEALLLSAIRRHPPRDASDVFMLRQSVICDLESDDLREIQETRRRVSSEAHVPYMMGRLLTPAHAADDDPATTARLSAGNLITKRFKGDEKAIKAVDSILADKGLDESAFDHDAYVDDLALHDILFRLRRHSMRMARSYENFVSREGREEGRGGGERQGEGEGGRGRGRGEEVNQSRSNDRRLLEK